jgi:hypothetical protein
MMISPMASKDYIMVTPHLSKYFIVKLAIQDVMHPHRCFRPVLPKGRSPLQYYDDVSEGA